MTNIYISLKALTILFFTILGSIINFTFLLFFSQALIADDVKVNGAELKDGLLTISCERIIPEHKKKKLIEIK